jgi:hypothetical protein
VASLRVSVAIAPWTISIDPPSRRLVDVTSMPADGDQAAAVNWLS